MVIRSTVLRRGPVITVGSPGILKPGSDILRKSSSQREPVSQSAPGQSRLSLFLERLSRPRVFPFGH